MATFEDVWRQARGLFPALPPLVVRSFVQDTYARICEAWGWGFLRKDALISTLASRTITATLTQGSATVTSAGLFVATDLGRTLRAASPTWPAYTIVTYTSANTVVLDRVYGATGGAVSVQILDLFVTMPADFGRFLEVIDPYNQRPIAFGIHESEIAQADPARTQSDSGPRALIATSPSPVTATLGQVRYECWPAPTAARQYPYRYVSRPALLRDETTLPGLLGTRGDLLLLGAQVQAAEYPGTNDLKNPYFNLTLAERLRVRYEGELQRLSLADDNQTPQQLWERPLSGVSLTSSGLRQTDATLDDYV